METDHRSKRTTGRRCDITGESKSEELKTDRYGRSYKQDTQRLLKKTEYLPVNRDEDEAQVVLRLYREMLLEIGEDWSKARSADERHHSHHHI